MLLEKVVAGLGKLAGADQFMRRIGEQAHYNIERGIIGWNIHEIPPEVVKAAYCGTCGVIEGLAIGTLFTNHFFLEGIQHEPGDLIPVMVLVGSCVMGSLILGTASAVKSLRESYGILADHPLRHVADGALSGGVLGLGLTINNETTPLSASLVFTAELAGVGAMVGAGASLVEISAIKTFNYVRSWFGT